MLSYVRGYIMPRPPQMYTSLTLKLKRDVHRGAGPHLDVQRKLSPGYLTAQQRGCTSSRTPRPSALVVSHRAHGVHQVARYTRVKFWGTPWCHSHLCSVRSTRRHAPRFSPTSHPPPPTPHQGPYSTANAASFWRPCGWVIGDAYA